MLAHIYGYARWSTHETFLFSARISHFTSHPLHLFFSWSMKGRILWVAHFPHWFITTHFTKWLLENCQAPIAPWLFYNQVCYVMGACGRRWCWYSVCNISSRTIWNWKKSCTLILDRCRKNNVMDKFFFFMYTFPCIRDTSGKAYK